MLMSPDSVTISIDSLSKRYAGSEPLALDKLSLQVHKGEVYGFLGPNGAGKSTAIRLLLNFIQPTKGSAKILGHDIVSDSVEIRKSIGYLSGDFSAYDKMTGEQFLSYMAELQGATNPAHRRELAKMFKIDLSKRIGSLSKGNRQKVGIIQALMHRPQILILDEPTDGLDPLMQETFYGLIRNCKEQGVTVFVSSHNLPEVRKMCDRVGIIKSGKLVSESSIAELEVEAAQTFYVTFKQAPPVSELKQLKNIKVASSKDNHVTLHVHGDLKPLLQLLAKHDVSSLSTHELDLEDEFMRFYESGVSK